LKDELPTQNHIYGAADQHSLAVLDKWEIKYRRLFDTVRDGFVMLDYKSKKVIDANPHILKILRRDLKQTIGKELCELGIFCDTKTRKQAFKELKTNGYVHFEDIPFEAPDGVRRIEFIANAYMDGAEHSIQCNIHDITEISNTRNSLYQSYQLLRKSLVGTISVISKTMELRDPYTSGHQLRVSQLSRLIAQEMGLDKHQVEGIRMGAQIHDIGKIMVPAELLSKPGLLSDIEYPLIKQHAEAGYNILKDIDFPWPIANIAYQHHERLDGSGYPRGLKGDEICLEARIVAVADVIEAMSSHRPYRASKGIEDAINEISSHKNTHYDENVVDACLKVLAEGKFSL